jgi:hypothetical protein
MNTIYQDRVNAFSLIAAQDIGIAKAKELGISVNSNIHDNNLWPKNDSPEIAKINRFGDRVIDIFGRMSHKYIYALAHPFNPSELYTIEYFLVDDHLISKEYISIQYGFKEALAEVISTAYNHDFSLSNATFSDSSAELYINDQLYAKISLAEFEESNPTHSKEIATLLKGIHSGREFSKEKTFKRLSKMPFLEGYEGHRMELDGKFIHHSIRNYVRGFQWLLESLSDDKVSLNQAEKVMWAFYGITNEHLLYANEKLETPTEFFYSVVINEDTTGNDCKGNIALYKTLPSAISGFRDRIANLELNKKPFHFDNTFGNITRIENPKVIKERWDIIGKYILSIDINKLSYSPDKEHMNEAERLINNKVTFSSRKDEALQSLTINDKTITIYLRNNQHHIESHLKHLVPIKNLVVGYEGQSREVDIFSGNIYSDETPTKEWGFFHYKYDKVQGREIELGELSLDDVHNIIKTLKIPALADECDFKEGEVKRLKELNLEYTSRTDFYTPAEFR